MKYAALSISLTLSLVGCSAVRANELALKSAARAAEVTVPIVGLMPFNGLTIEQIYKLRSDAVNRHKNLLADTYEPSDAIFGLCESKKPWWGIQGWEMHGPGQKSIEGPAKESAYLLNPFRLISAEVCNSAGAGRSEMQTIWNPKALTAADLRNPSFPYLWESGPVQFGAARASAQVTYDVSAYNSRAYKFKDRLCQPNKQLMGFSLIAYNARDFGYRYIYLDAHNSPGVRPWATNRPVEITQFIHCGGSCGYPGGCNNMSPYIAELDRNSLLKLPARAYLKLWSNEPPSASSQADFTFIIDFK